MTSGQTYCKSVRCNDLLQIKSPAFFFAGLLLKTRQGILGLKNYLPLRYEAKASAIAPNIAAIAAGSGMTMPFRTT